MKTPSLLDSIQSAILSLSRESQLDKRSLSPWLRLQGFLLYGLIALLTIASFNIVRARNDQTSDFQEVAFRKGRQWMIKEESTWGQVVCTCVNFYRLDWQASTFVLEDYTRGRTAVYSGETYHSPDGNTCLRLKRLMDQPQDNQRSFQNQNQTVPAWPNYVFLRPSFDTSQSDGISRDRIVIALGDSVCLAERRADISSVSSLDSPMSGINNQSWRVRSVRTATQGTSFPSIKMKLTLTARSADSNRVNLVLNEETNSSFYISKHSPSSLCFPLNGDDGRLHVTLDRSELWLVPNEQQTEFIRATK